MGCATTDTANVEESRWRLPLVDEDWHAVCQAIFNGIDGEEWERMHCKYIEIHKSVNIRHRSTSRKAKTLKKREATANGETYYDQATDGKLTAAVRHPL